MASAVNGIKALQLVCTNTANSMFGNSKFDQFNIYTEGANSIGVYMNGSRYSGNDHIMNLNTLDNMQIFTYGGATGVYIESNVYDNTWLGVDVEGYDTGIYIGGIQNHDSHNNIFLGGYINAFTNAIKCDQWSRANKFIDIEIGGGAIVEGSAWVGNYYENLGFENTPVVSSTYGYGRFAGGAYGWFFDCYTPFSSIANGTDVQIGGGASNGLVGTPTIVMITLASRGYAWYTVATTNSTYVRIYFDGTDASTVSGSVYTGWYP
jgi:hypothetical protein